jgi:hypothetical protein
MTVSRRTILCILGVILILTIIVKFSLLSCFDDGGFLLNLITEIIGAIITFIVIDNILNYNEQQEKKRLQYVAIRSLKQPIRRYLWAWIHVSTGEMTATTELQATTISAYLTSDIFINRIRQRSFDEPFTTSHLLGEDKPLRIEFPKIIEGFQSDVKDILKTYAYALDTEFIRQLQHFTDDAHLYNTISFYKNINIGNNIWFTNVDTVDIRSHFTEFIRLLETYNTSVEETEQWTNQNIMNLNRVSGQVPNVKW